MTQQRTLPIDPRILGQRLQVARKRANLTQQDVAEEIKLARTTIVAIEKGERLPKEEELLQFSTLYQRPLDDLLRQYIPSEPLIVQFRSAHRTDTTLGAQIEAEINGFQDLCEDYLHLEQILASPLSLSQAPIYPSSPIENITTTRLGEEAASTERNRLGLGDAPLFNLRELLEQEGIRIFLLDLPSRVSGFFGYTEILGPCIAINKHHPTERRQWSLAHEYAHFLTNRRQPNISIYYKTQYMPENERFADAFARAFLMPTTSITRRFVEAKRMRGQIIPADICLLAHFFCVSFEAMTRRLENLQLIRDGGYDRIIERGFKPQEAFSLLQLEPHIIDNEMLPLRYQFLAIEAYSKGEITDEEFSRLLRTDLVTARHIYNASRTQRMVDANGEDTYLAVPFDDDLRV